MIDLRGDAPDQSDIIDPVKLSEEIEKLKSMSTTFDEYLFLSNNMFFLDGPILIV